MVSAQMLFGRDLVHHVNFQAKLKGSPHDGESFCKHSFLSCGMEITFLFFLKDQDELILAIYLKQMRIADTYGLKKQLQCLNFLICVSLSSYLPELSFRTMIIQI